MKLILPHPFWLILLIPAAALLLRRKFPSPVPATLRTIIFFLLVLSLCKPALKLGSNAGTVVVLADRSSSMPAQSQAGMKETIALIRSAMTEEDNLAVVSFARQTAVERTPLPKKAGDFSGFAADVGAEHSDLSRGLETALSLIPQDASGRILLLSDGKYTGADPRTPAMQASARGIAADFRHFRRSLADDTAIVKLSAPESVTSGQSFLIRSEIQSPAEQELHYTLFRGTIPIASGSRKFSPGNTALLFRDQAENPGTHVYALEIADLSGRETDSIPENNRAKLLVGVEGSRPLLHVTSSPDSGLARLLRKSRLDIHSIPAEKISWSLETLSQYAALILENLPADAIGYPGMETVSAWVRHTGAGLMVTGGMNAYGPGGYFRSPLEPVLPVSMELRNEHRKMRLAMVIVLDRSGSMAAAAGRSYTKMDLANIGAVQVLDLLSPFDEFGLIAVDSAVHNIVDLKPADKADAERGKILSIDAGGGGIFVYSGLAAAAEMLLRAKAETRHIILFADAADAEEPGEYKTLMEKCVKANITVSVIGLGTPQDKDAPLLEDIAIIGRGQSFFTIHPQEIPRLFAQDTFAVARSAFVKEATAITPTAALSGMSDISFGAFPQIGGYNLCYARPEAAQALLAQDEYRAPVLAYWHSGKGRVIAYAGEADGEFTGPMAHWAKTGDFFSSLARWAAGEQSILPENMLITRELDKGILRIELHLDPERKNEPFAESPKVDILRGIPGKTPVQESRTMAWTSADTLALEVPIESSETLLPTVEIPGMNAIDLSPVCLPYSPEFLPSFDNKDGKENLAEIARISGGKERINLAEIWKDLPEKQQYVEISHWLILSALAIFLLEILQRRTGILSLRLLKKMQKMEKRIEKSAEKSVKKKQGFAQKEKAGKTETVSAKEIPKEKVPAPSEAQDAFTAMQRAKKMAKNRMQR
ncbi:MAG: VWA domain-containing protein [Desulfobacterales bacterium]